MALLPRLTMPASPSGGDEMDMDMMRSHLEALQMSTPFRSGGAASPAGRTERSTPDACMPPLMDDDDSPSRAAQAPPPAFAFTAVPALQPANPPRATPAMSGAASAGPGPVQQAAAHQAPLPLQARQLNISHPSQLQCFVQPKPSLQQRQHQQQQQQQPPQPQPQQQHAPPLLLPQRLPVVQSQPQAQRPAAAQTLHTLPRESYVCTDRACGALAYGPPRGTNMRVSWRNKLWSDASLLQARFGWALPRFFRPNYADRSPASEPLLHNNYPAGSRVYFQGRVSAAHCLCHHLVQIFEAFALTPDGKPDPVGLQALWIAPSQTDGRVFGYVKYTEARMAAAAVMGLRAQSPRTGGAAGARRAVAPRDAVVQVLESVGAAMVPPLLPQEATGSCGPWSPKALGVLRVCHALAARFRAGCALAQAVPHAVVNAAVAEVEAAAKATFGDGVVTEATVDALGFGYPCPHHAAQRPPAEPVVIDDISLANEQRPGHRLHSRQQAPQQQQPRGSGHHHACQPLNYVR